MALAVQQRPTSPSQGRSTIRYRWATISWPLPADASAIGLGDDQWAARDLEEVLQAMWPDYVDNTSTTTTG